MAFRNVKQSLQDLAELKEAEQKEKEKQQKELAELEQLKQDIILLIENELVEITKNSNNLFMYYLDNKSEILENIYNNLFDVKNFYLLKLNKGLSSYNQFEFENASNIKELNDNAKENLTIIDKDNKIKKVFVKYPKWDVKEFNKEKTILFVDNLLSDKIKEITKNDTLYKKEETKEEKEKAEDLKNYILDIFIKSFNKTKEKEPFSFSIAIASDKVQNILIEDFNINLDIKENRTAYIEALKEFKKLYCIGNKPIQKAKENKTIFGLSPLLAIIGAFIGICDASLKHK